jgi:hypothetical protein
MRRLAVVVALACAACSRKPKDVASCGTVASRLFTIARDELAKATVDATTRRAVSDQLPAMRDALTQACTDDAWPVQARNCMANAADHLAFQTCQQQLTDDQRHRLDRASRGQVTETRSP